MLTLPPMDLMFTDAPLAAFAHVGQRGHGCVESSPKHDGHGAFEILDCHLLDGPHLSDTGIIHQHVESAKTLDRFRNGAFHLISLRDVAAMV